MKPLILSCFFALLFFVTTVRADNFIFDLDGVVLGTRSVACLKHMELNNIIKTMILQKQGPLPISKQIKVKLFAILDNVAHAESIQTPNCFAYDKNGKLYPSLMCAWLNGLKTNAEIRLLVSSSIKNHPEWFVNETEERIISNLVNMIFTPEYFISTRKTHRKALRFMRHQRRQGHKIYVLSNWDAESFKVLKNKFPEVFKLVDGIIISGKVHDLKPSPLIYQTLLDRFNLDPERSWFIDDQLDNINAACVLNIKGIKCQHSRCRKKPNFRLIKKQIKN